MAQDEETKQSLESAVNLATTAVTLGGDMIVPGLGTLLVPMFLRVLQVNKEANVRKAQAFAFRLIHGLETEEEVQQKVAAASGMPEFAELVQTILQDMEVEKAEVYALVTLHMMQGDIPVDLRRDVIDALRQLRIEDLVFLFEIHVNGGTKQMHEKAKLQTARHPGIIQRLSINACLDQDSSTVTAFGKQIVDWTHTELPLPPPHENQGRHRKR